MPVRLDWSAEDFGERFRAFLTAERAGAEDVAAVVADILREVRLNGDAALLAYTERFDRIGPPLRVPAETLDRALAEAESTALEALRLAADRIEAFHRRQLPQDIDYTDEAGIRLGMRWTPIDSVGLYVPGGTAAYPSSVLMNAIPARVAGVGRVAMAVPTPEGVFDPLVFAAARLAGVHDVYRIGGAQAVAALAFGTGTVPAVDKIVGPGNAFVAEAKRQVFGHVGIDSIAGPSEVLVVADGSCPPTWIAADLLAQAEHDASAQSILITHDASYADAVETAVRRYLAELPRADIAHLSWERHGAVILVPDLGQAPPLIDAIAPEHLQLAVREPDGLAARVRHAGAIFLGADTPEAVGDYVGGPNHVLPTSGGARFASGLGVLDFMKRTTLLGCGGEGLRRIGPAAVRLAAVEGLDAHGLSVFLRLLP